MSDKLDKFLEIRSLSLVFIGDFNPIIITPAWLVLKGLIREEEAENATVGVLLNNLVQYDLDWVSINITRDRCEFKTSKTPYFDAVRDLASSIFILLKETPIRFLGLNHIFELRMPNEDLYYTFGTQLTNLNIWDDELNDPRMMSLEITEEVRKDKINGRYKIRISPTGTNIKFGISIDINDHLTINGSAKSASELLVSHWENSLHRAQKVTSKFLEKLEL